MLDALFSTIIFSCGIAKIIEIGKDLTVYGEIVPRLLDFGILTQQPSEALSFENIIIITK